MADHLKKRRGTQRGSVTRLGTRVTELEGIANQPGTTGYARQLLTKLKSHDEEFKNLHFQIIDSIDEGDDAALDDEQTVLDNFDDAVSDLTVRLESLITCTAPVPPPGPATPFDRRPLNRKLVRVKVGLNRVDARMSDEVAVPERPELNQFREELSDYKKDLAVLYEDLVTRDITDDDALFDHHSRLERKLSSVSQKLKGLHLLLPLQLK